MQTGSLKQSRTIIPVFVRASQSPPVCRVTNKIRVIYLFIYLLLTSFSTRIFFFFHLSFGTIAFYYYKNVPQKSILPVCIDVYFLSFNTLLLLSFPLLLPAARPPQTTQIVGHSRGFQSCQDLGGIVKKTTCHFILNFHCRQRVNTD